MRTAERPSAIKIKVGSKMLSFWREVFESRFRRSGMIRTLEGITEDKAMGDAGISEKDKVEITGGHFINFINDQKFRMLKERGFPSADTPRFGRW